jgi:benzil reductase ((S)-benzoin forming)
MEYVIITGASRGLGASLARTLLDTGRSVFCIARSVNAELIAESEAKGTELHWIQADLQATDGIAPFMQDIARSMDTDGADLICLINNAAVLGPVGPVGSIPGKSAGDELRHAAAVNLVAPMTLTHLFVSLFSGAPGRKVIINVSSGAALQPMPGLSTYSATKAALNMFTAAAATDLPPESGFEFYAVSPGTVDTEMQGELRAAGPDRLREHATYARWKDEGQLVPPETAARRVLSLLDRSDIASGSYTQARELHDG